MSPPAALLGFALGLAVAPEGDPAIPDGSDVPEECRESAAALAAAAEQMLAPGGSRLPRAPLERARSLYRRARRLSPSPDLSLRAADIAAAAGDDEESGDLLSEVAETSPDQLSASERWILLRRAESRREWRDALLHARALQDLEAGSAEADPWLTQTLRRLEVALEAQAIASPPLAPPSAGARRALADGRRALGAGDLTKARERLGLALRLAPGYVEAALALAALEAREGRTPDAIRAFRSALAADPIRFEALVGLAEILWDEPDRNAKLEGLALLDRAVALRPEALAQARLAATRWAEWGDAAAALDRLESFRSRASLEERSETEALRESLLRRVRSGLARDPEATVGSELPELTSPALEEWKVAQVYFRRGDPASLAAALDRLAEAERLDPGFARAAELAGTIHERSREVALAEAAYQRSILADPTRAAPYERLALLLGRQPDRARDAEEMWRRAEAAGSAESLFYLGAAALREGRRSSGLSLYRRYLQESPGGVHSEEAARTVSRLEAERKSMILLAAFGLFLLAAASLALLYRRRSGVTLEQWLRRSASKGREVRPIAGRLRHEVLKHGGLLLSDGAASLREGDAAKRGSVAKLLLTRLHGPAATDGRLGLIAEAEDALTRLRDLARRDEHRLNVARDPLLSPIARAAAVLRRIEPPLEHIAQNPAASDPTTVRKAVEGLERASALFQQANPAELMRVIDRAASISVSLPALRELFARLSEETRVEPPALEALGLLSDPTETVRVRIDRADWETIWRNLFGNAVAGRDGRSSERLRMAVGAERLRDPATGAPIARFLFADNLAAALTSDTLQGSAADRGWGVVADLLRRHEGSATVGPAPSAEYSKGIFLELPAPEPEAAG